MSSLEKKFVTARMSMLNNQIYQTAAKHKNLVKQKHDLMLKENKTWVRILDVIMIFSILFNMGALAITNALVVKAENKTVFYEGNTITKDRFGFASVPEERKDEIKSKLYGFLVHCVLLTILVFIYCAYRFTFTEYHTLGTMTAFAIMLFALLGLDFSNDLGMWIGTKLISMGW